MMCAYKVNNSIKNKKIQVWKDIKVHKSISKETILLKSAYFTKKKMERKIKTVISKVYTK